MKVGWEQGTGGEATEGDAEGVVGRTDVIRIHP